MPDLCMAGPSSYSALSSSDRPSLNASITLIVFYQTTLCHLIALVTLELSCALFIHSRGTHITRLPHARTGRAVKTSGVGSLRTQSHWGCQVANQHTREQMSKNLPERSGVPSLSPCSSPESQLREAARACDIPGTDGAGGHPGCAPLLLVE